MHYLLYFFILFLAYLFLVLSIVDRKGDFAIFPLLAMINFSAAALASLDIEFPYYFFNTSSSTAESITFAINDNAMAYYNAFMFFVCLILLIYRWFLTYPHKEV